MFNLCLRTYGIPAPTVYSRSKILCHCHSSSLMSPPPLKATLGLRATDLETLNLGNENSTRTSTLSLPHQVTGALRASTNLTFLGTWSAQWLTGREQFSLAQGCGFNAGWTR
ncbi:hypothetical protein TNCV_4286891 [Trichonephila clavipes]|nr:hypothetical protein TNCV_4286891 [Trichonephila clavipes]